MSIEIKKNLIIEGIHNRPILADLYYKPSGRKKPVVIYSHGYKGFKDWGANELLAHEFAKNNVFFLKFNFSHNGGTIKQPIDFPDLEAFSDNNFTKELDDLKSVIDRLYDFPELSEEIDINNLTLMGHSRGSGISIIKADEDERVSGVISLAGVSNYGSRFPDGEALNTWKKEGVAYILNARTKQQMPLKYQLYQDYIANKNRLDIERAANNLNKPHLIIHGTDDPTVSTKEAEAIHRQSSKGILKIIKGADHVFNATHPWKEPELPESLKKAINYSLDFINP